MDEIDNHCKTLSNNYSCLQLDHQNCYPENIEYNEINISNFLNESDKQLVSLCQSVNVDPCKIAACSSEAKFSRDVINLFLAGGVENDSFSHARGFQPKNSCMVKGVNSVDRRVNFLDTKSLDSECCGEFPSRFPFRTFDRKRACCQGKTYDTTGSLECCENEGLQLFSCFR